MKLRYNIIKGFTLIVLMGAVTLPSYAQLENVGAVLQSGTEDANTLIRAYLHPFGSGFGAGLNTGWTNTAKTHRKLGFDVTISAGLAIVPDADKVFDVTQIGLQRLQYESGPMESQTINGADEAGSTLAAYTTADLDGPGGNPPQDYKITEFTMPNGTGFGFVPAPMIKAGIGLVKDTDVMLRYTPEYEINNFGSFQLFGFGVKHGINQWLPAGNLLPVNLSLLFGYTSMDVTGDFNVTPDDVIQDPANTENPYSADTWDGQGIELGTNAWTVNALVGKTLPMVSIYGGVGYEASTLGVNTPGAYPTVVPNPAYETDPNNNQPWIVESLEEPIDIEIEGKNGLRALAGFRFRFAIFHISGSYTLADYSSYNLAFGISFR